MHMKRILAITLALILVLSCSPNVFATEAEEELGYSEALANMDPKIKEIIASQMSQEEKDALVALDPSLEDALLLKVFSFTTQFYRDEYHGEKTIDAISSAVKQTDRGSCYYLLSDTPQRITFSKDPDSGAVTVLKEYYKSIEILLQRIIVNLAPQVVIDGNTVDVTGIYLFGDMYNQVNFIGGAAVYIQTEAGPLFYLYDNPAYFPELTRTFFILSESEFQKYVDQYSWYCKINHAHHDINAHVSNLHHFIKYNDMYMAKANEMQAELRRQALKTYGPIALGVVLVAGCAVTGVVIYRKRKKKALAIQDTPDTTDF